MKKISRGRQKGMSPRRRRSPRRIKKRAEADGNIEVNDIIYQDELVCILHPHVKKGILVWTSYDQPEGSDSLCKVGLKTGEQLHKEAISFGRSIYHPYIFFRAPYIYSPEIDYSTFETEIVSSYGAEILEPNKLKSKVFIRVDPERTYTFSSEIRAKKSRDNYEIISSQKLLSKYLEIIHDNVDVERNGFRTPGKTLVYNLQSSKASMFPESYRIAYPYDRVPINRNSEILVSIPHLTKEYFVNCT
jgi:hypothetical protein